MKKLLLLFSGLSLFSCATTHTNISKLTLEATLSHLNTRTENDSSPLTYSDKVEDRLPHQITILDQDKRTLSFELQGWYGSRGLNAHKIKILSNEEIKGDTLYLTYNVHIYRQGGKEGDLINGFNYTQKEKHQIKENIKEVYISLINDNKEVLASQIVKY